MFSPEASTWKGRLRVPLLDQIHCFGFFRIERMTGFEPAVFCLGSRRATTAPHPHGRAFFRIRRTAVTCCPPVERGWLASE